MAIESQKRNSILGGIALLLAVPVVGLNYLTIHGLPDVRVGPFTLSFVTAVTGSTCALALLSLMLSSSSRRTGTELPLAALCISFVALGVGYFRHRPAPPANAATPVMATAPQPSPQTPPAAQVQKPAVGNKSAVASGPNAAQKARGAAANAANLTVRQRNLAVLKEAQAQYDQARSAVMKSLESDPNYTAAKAQDDSAQSELKTARANNTPGSPALVTAIQNSLATHARLQSVIDAAIGKDPTARNARDELDAAKALVKTAPTGKP